MKNLWFCMFDSETKLFKKRENDIITTKKICIWFFKKNFLRNEKTVIYKRKSGDRDIM